MKTSGNVKKKTFNFTRQLRHISSHRKTITIENFVTDSLLYQDKVYLLPFKCICSNSRETYDTKGWFPYDHRRSQTIADRRSQIADDRKESCFHIIADDRRADCSVSGSVKNYTRVVLARKSQQRDENLGPSRR